MAILTQKNLSAFIASLFYFLSFPVSDVLAENLGLRDFLIIICKSQRESLFYLFSFSLLNFIRLL